jgi:transposase
MVNLATETRIETLRQVAQLQEQELKRLTKKVAELSKLVGKDAEQILLEIARLQEEADLRRKKMFGSSSEKRKKERSKSESPKKPQTGHGPTEQKDLPVEEEHVELSVGPQPCCSCVKQGVLEKWEGQTEDSELIDVVERRYVVKQIRRQKYRYSCGCGVVTAPVVPKLIPQGRYSPNVAIQIAIDKYADHLPLERQVKAMARQGLKTTSQSLFDQLWGLAEVLRPVWLRLGEYVRKQLVLFVDESRWPLFPTKYSKKVKTTKWHIWTMASEQGVFYLVQGTRSTQGAKNLLQDYQGHVMCDGFSSYNYLRTKEGIYLHQCWSHARRKFYDLQTSFPEESNYVLDELETLYRWEKEASKHEEPDKERARMRKEKARPVLEKLKTWMIEQQAVPESGLHGAIQYALNRWKELLLYLEYPHVPMDNNFVERELRNAVNGRKNHYGSRSERGTEVAGIFYSFLETCKLLGINPHRYLKYVVDAAFHGQPILLPHEFKER